MTPVDKIKFLETRPGIDYGLILEAGLFALEQKQGLPFNSRNWGFADLTFEEHVFPSTESNMSRNELLATGNTTTI